MTDLQERIETLKKEWSGERPLGGGEALAIIDELKAKLEEEEMQFTNMHDGLREKIDEQQKLVSKLNEHHGMLTEENILLRNEYDEQQREIERLKKVEFDSYMDSLDGDDV